MLSWIYKPDTWSFDVSSLIILVGESEEMSYRLSQRSLLECVAAAPVIGLQSYIRSYDVLLQVGSLNYFTPYGCKTAPLRNFRLQNAIEVQQLLRDGRYNVYSIPPASNKPPRGHRRTTCLMSLWVIFTWLFFGGVLVLLFLVDTYPTTWIGFINYVALSSWSMVVRVTEYLLVRPAPSTGTNKPENQDAVFILGRRESAFVLEGSRQDVKNWTGCGLAYGRDLKLRNLAPVCQAFTRLVSFLVLVLIFTTMPNGSTMDQTAFILLNVLGQANVLIGRRLNSRAYLEGLELHPDSNKNVHTRTEIYGLLVQRFKDIGRGDSAWVDACDMLPKTDAWEEWKKRMLTQKNAKSSQKIYDDVVREFRGHWRATKEPEQGDVDSKQSKFAEASSTSG